MSHYKSLRCMSRLVELKKLEARVSAAVFQAQTMHHRNKFIGVRNSIRLHRTLLQKRAGDLFKASRGFYGL